MLPCTESLPLDWFAKGPLFILDNKIMVKFIFSGSTVSRLPFLTMITAAITVIIMVPVVADDNNHSGF